MGSQKIRALRQHGVRTAARAVLMAAACLLALPAHAEAAKSATKLYKFRVNGMLVYTDRKPQGIDYTEITPGGRPTAAKACVGVTEKIMQARATELDKLVAKHASAQGVPAALVRAVMRVESCFDRRAVSRSGARGLMQLMPFTAAQMGVADSFDADQNIKGGVRYLKMMLERFNDDVRLALAAYNAGPEMVAKHRGIPPFPQTRSYVHRVLVAYEVNARKKVHG